MPITYKDVHKIWDEQCRTNKETKKMTKVKIRQQLDEAIEHAQGLRQGSMKRLQDIIETVEQIAEVIELPSLLMNAAEND